jgi:hypothetical protein
LPLRFEVSIGVRAFAGLRHGTELARRNGVLAACLLVFAAYLVVAHWTIWLQGSSVAPLIFGVGAFLAAWPAVGWPLALLVFVVDPGCLLYFVLCVLWLRKEVRPPRR